MICRCGDCCRMVIRISSADIKRIEKSGIDLSPKLARDIDGSILLGKAKNGYCHFLKWDGDTAVCGIYDIRPKVCRAFECEPFKEFSKNLNFISLRKKSQGP